MEPWQWPEERWRSIVEKVRAGRSLKPAQWPGGARVAVAQQRLAHPVVATVMGAGIHPQKGRRQQL